MVNEGTLGRIDTPPLDNADIPDELKLWLTNLVDTLNETIRNIELLLP
jgi:hypothetical protein